MDIVVDTLMSVLCGFLFAVAVGVLLLIVGSLSKMLASMGKLGDMELLEGTYEVMKNWWLQY